MVYYLGKQTEVLPPMQISQQVLETITDPTADRQTVREQLIALSILNGGRKLRSARKASVVRLAQWASGTPAAVS
jgi:hypothetical protein